MPLLTDPPQPSVSLAVRPPLLESPYTVLLPPRSRVLKLRHAFALPLLLAFLLLHLCAAYFRTSICSQIRAWPLFTDPLLFLLPGVVLYRSFLPRVSPWGDCGGGGFPSLSPLSSSALVGATIRPVWVRLCFHFKVTSSVLLLLPCSNSDSPSSPTARPLRSWPPPSRHLRPQARSLLPFITGSA